MTCTASVVISSDKSLRCSQLSGTDRWCPNHRSAYLDNYRSYKVLTNHIKASLEVIDIKNVNTLTIDQLQPIVPKLREMIERRITHSKSYFAFGPQDTDDEIGHMAIIEKYTQIYQLLNPIYSKLRQEVKAVTISKQTPIILPEQQEFPYYVPTKEQMANIKRNKAEEAAKRIPTVSKTVSVNVKTPLEKQPVPPEFNLNFDNINLDSITADAPDYGIIDYKITLGGHAFDGFVNPEQKVVDAMMKVVRLFIKYKLENTITYCHAEYICFVAALFNRTWGKRIGRDIIITSLIAEYKECNPETMTKMITKGANSNTHLYQLIQSIEELAKVHVPIFTNTQTTTKYQGDDTPDRAKARLQEQKTIFSNIIVGRSCYDLIMKSPYVLNNTFPIRNNMPLPKYFPSIIEVKMTDKIIKYKLGVIEKEFTMNLCSEVVTMIGDSIDYLKSIKQQQSHNSNNLLKLFFSLIQYKIIKMDNEAKSRWFCQALNSDDLFFTFTNYCDLRHVLDNNNKLFGNQYIAWLTLYNIIEYLINTAKVLGN